MDAGQRGERENISGSFGNAAVSLMGVTGVDALRTTAGFLVGVPREHPSLATRSRCISCRSCAVRLKYNSKHVDEQMHTRPSTG